MNKRALDWLIVKLTGPYKKLDFGWVNHLIVV